MGKIIDSLVSTGRMEIESGSCLALVEELRVLVAERDALQAKLDRYESGDYGVVKVNDVVFSSEFGPQRIVRMYSCERRFDPDGVPTEAGTWRSALGGWYVAKLGNGVSLNMARLEPMP